MKKKVFLAVLMLCAVLSASACGSSEKKDTTTKTETEKTADEKEEKAEEPKEEAKGSHRIVSVEDIDKYITLGEYKGLSLDNTVEPVSDEDVQSRIDTELQNKAEVLEDSNAEVMDGDIVNINYVGTKDGVAFDGGTADNQDLTIGSGQFIDGFEAGVVGMKKGDTKDLNLTFPEEYPAADLAGADVVFQVTLNSIKRAPELTDAWVEKNTEYKNIEEYKAGIRKAAEESAKAMMEANLQNTAFGSVMESTEVKEYPEEDMKNAANDYRTQIEAYAKQAGMELKDLLETQGVSEEDFQAQCDQYAEFRVKQTMIVQAIMDAEGLSFEDEACNELKDALAKQYGEEKFEGLVAMYGEQVSYEALGFKYVCEFMIDNAKLEEPSAETAEDLEEENFQEEDSEEKPEDTKAEEKEDTEE